MPDFDTAPAMKPAIALLTAGIALAAHGLLLADTSGRSLTDVRKQINSGTWPGITLIEAAPKAKPPAASASAPAAPAASAADASPAPAAAAAHASTPATSAANTSAPATPAANPSAPATPAAGALAPPAVAASPAAAPVAPVASPSPPTPSKAAGISAPAAPIAKVPAAEPAAVPPAPATSAPSFGDRLRGWLGEPLSGQSMQEAKRLDSPSIGIPLPTAAAGAASAPVTPAR